MQAGSAAHKASLAKRGRKVSDSYGPKSKLVNGQRINIKTGKVMQSGLDGGGESEISGVAPDFSGVQSQLDQITQGFSKYREEQDKLAEDQKLKAQQQEAQNVGAAGVGGGAQSLRGGSVPYNQALTNLRGGGLAGEELSMAERSLANAYGVGFEQANASGVQPGDTGQLDDARSYLPADTDKGDFISQLFGNDPTIQGAMASLQEFFSPMMQRESLVDTYREMYEDMGFEQLDTDLINTKNLIEGQEDAVRLEITKAGGFATEQQVQALSNARNKQLIKNYNTLLDTKNAQMDYLNTMMSLEAQDRQMAQTQMSTMLGAFFNVASFVQSSQQMSMSALQYTMSLPGGGEAIMAGYDNNPTIRSIADKYYGGLAGLQSITGAVSADRARQIALENAQIAAAGRGRYQLLTRDDGSVVRVNIDTGEATEILGGGLESGLSTEDIKFINDSPQGKKVLSAADLKIKMTNYENLLKGQNPVLVTSKQRATLQSAYQDLLLSFKEAAKLGVLAGPDMEIIEGAVKPPIRRGHQMIFSKGPALTSVTEAQSALNRTAIQNIEQLSAVDPRYVASDYVQTILSPFGFSVVVAPDGSVIMLTD